MKATVALYRRRRRCRLPSYRVNCAIIHKTVFTRLTHALHSLHVPSSGTLTLVSCNKAWTTPRALTLFVTCRRSFFRYIWMWSVFVISWIRVKGICFAYASQRWCYFFLLRSCIFLKLLIFLCPLLQFSIRNWQFFLGGLVSWEYVIGKRTLCGISSPFGLFHRWFQ